MIPLQSFSARNSCMIALLVVFCTLCSVSSNENETKRTAELARRIRPWFDEVHSADIEHLAQPAPRRGGRGAPAATGDVFRAFWNLPNSCGDRYGIDLPLAKYGIEFNSNHNWTHGDVVTLFYSNVLGFYPHYENGTSKMPIPVNGGLPQLGNITQHLEKATADIMAAIPDPDYDGIGVIDWESWRPQWQQNFDNLAVYREKSRDHVRGLHPTWDDATVETVAELEWTQGAKLYMQSTLKLAKSLRPKAVWGYYAFPYCFNHKDGAVMNCTDVAMTTNDAVMWLFNESSALYPSIYLRPTHPYERAYVKGKLAEAFRLRDRSSDPKGAILSYTRFNYSHSGLYFTEEDLNNTILLSAEMGTHGVVFWGDNLDEQGAPSCTELFKYINGTLGPVVMATRKAATSCSKRVCSGRGRCVGNITTCGKKVGAQESKRKRSRGERHRNDVCVCRCFVGWKGADCSISSVY